MSDNGLNSQLKHILECHKGRAQAITARELSHMTGQDDRKVRLVIRDLITNGLPVASSTEFPGGYFVVSTWEEVRQYAKSIRNRLIEDAIRRRDFNRSAALYLQTAEQGRLI